MLLIIVKISIAYEFSRLVQAVMRLICFLEVHGSIPVMVFLVLQVRAGKYPSYPEDNRESKDDVCFSSHLVVLCR